MLDEFLAKNKEVLHIDRWPLIDIGGETFQTLDYVMRMVDSVRYWIC